MAASLESLRKVRDGGPPLATLTAYDYPSARLLDEAGVDLILVGDSLGMVVLGYEDTTHVTLAEMRHHTRAARRGVKRAVLVGDLPYKTYETPKQAVESARQLLDDGADAVKLEGGREVEPQVRALIDDGIPIIGHLGMLPQRIQEEGRYRKKGKSEDEAARLLDDAQLLDKLGVKAMVLESMFRRVAREITEAVSIPTIGIGAGNGCDGQILVTHDLIGAFPWFCPPFAIPKANVAESISRAVSAYVEDVRTSHD
ncbi:MAG: 3-methyl-2-oxobutanoate hydroxymethyltransferase [Verrucomicrobiaceae bacterium]|nr:3-methyl-2-oxobutanoate hydroxymethyltransferase [Verrucomicrobiaceae bacterium]NCF94118.1 3-methyl-2-oxobutanoate hydroxymethyltransferase [Verrucomicrobiaceae bacterium]